MLIWSCIENTADAEESIIQVSTETETLQTLFLICLPTHTHTNTHIRDSFSDLSLPWRREIHIPTCSHGPRPGVYTSGRGRRTRVSWCGRQILRATTCFMFELVNMELGHGGDVECSITNTLRRKNLGGRKSVVIFGRWLRFQPQTSTCWRLCFQLPIYSSFCWDIRQGGHKHTSSTQLLYPFISWECLSSIATVSNKKKKPSGSKFQPGPKSRANLVLQK